MKQVNISIQEPDSKFDKLMKFLAKNFGNVSLNESEDIYVPEWQKK